MAAPRWHAENIKAELRKKHGSITAVAKAWGVNQPAVSAVFNDPGRSMRIERLIGATLGVELHLLWPDRWHSDGTPKPRPRASAYELRPIRKSQKQKAA